MARRRRVNLYVDGFNLYYGGRKGTRNKWLDLVASAVPCCREIRSIGCGDSFVVVSNDSDLAEPITAPAADAVTAPPR